MHFEEDITDIIDFLKQHRTISFSDSCKEYIIADLREQIELFGF